MKTEHWLIGAAVVGGGLFLLHNASAGEPEKKSEKVKPDAKPAPAPTPATSAPAAAPTAPSSFPVGTHVEAQDRADGKWYGATVQFLDLGNPDAVRWDAGTPPAKRNPKTGTSPASAVRAAKGTATPAKGSSPSADELKEIARKAADAAAAAQTEANVKAANAGAATATENPAAALSAILGSILH